MDIKEIVKDNEVRFATARLSKPADRQVLGRVEAMTPNHAFERTRCQRDWCSFTAVRCVLQLARAAQRGRWASLQ